MGPRVSIARPIGLAIAVPEWKGSRPLVSIEPHSRRPIAAVLAPVGAACAGILGACLWQTDPGEPAQPLLQILGSGLTLLALGGLIVCGARWRGPVIGAIARPWRRAQTRAPRLLRLLCRGPL